MNSQSAPVFRPSLTLAAPSTPFCRPFWPSLGRTGPRSGRRDRGRVRDAWPLSWSCRPDRAVPLHPEHVQTTEVDCGGTGHHVGDDSQHTAGASLAGTPLLARQVPDLPLDLRPIGLVVILPVGVLLFGLVGLEDLFVGMDGDGPPTFVGGALAGQRAGGAGFAEAGDATAIVVEADVADLAGRAGHRA